MPAVPKSSLRTRRQDQASQRYQDAKARRVCTDTVWNRAGDALEGWGNCERCRAFVLRASSYPHLLGHVHERVPRSLGGSPTDPANCELLCGATCHPEAHRLRVSA